MPACQVVLGTPGTFFANAQCSYLIPPLQKSALSDVLNPTDELSALKVMKEMQNNKSWKERPSSKMFMKLFRYIAGVNKEREEVEMTVPVLTTNTPLEVSSTSSSWSSRLWKKQDFLILKDHILNCQGHV